MSMERWNPFRDMDMMRQSMDRWFDDRFPERGSMSSGMGQNLSIAVDLHETDNGYELMASLPGVRAEDIDITVNRDTITLRGKSESDEERKQGNYIYHERRSGSFHRTIRLPEAVNSEQIEAELDHGVLRVTLPRLQQTPNRRVQVRSGLIGNQSIGTGQTGAMMSGTSGMSNMAGSSLDRQAGMVESNMGSNPMSGSSSRMMGSQEGSGATSGMSSSGPNVGETGMSGGGVLHNNTSGQSEQPRIGSSSMSGSSAMSGGMERPSIMNTMSSTQMDELDRHARDKNEQGFRSQAQSYGWDQSTVDQVWRYMTRQATGDEARRAFESQGGDPSQQRPTNSL